MKRMSVIPNPPQLGTLLWIGDSTSAEFRQPYQYSVSHVAQVALRRDLDDARERPAAGVRAIVIAQAERCHLEKSTIANLRLLYPHAAILNVLGTLCEGMHAKTMEPALGRSERIYWHQWKSTLPDWLSGCGSIVERQQAMTLCRSVAVLSATPMLGEPLMDLAESAGVTSVWCRGANTWQIRQVDAVWWDDSVASPVTSEEWRARTETFASPRRHPQHAWIANSPRLDQQAQAIDGGVSLVLSKPYRIDSLLGMLSANAGVIAERSQQRLHAA